MTNPYRKPEPAIIRDLDGEPQLNRAALNLLFGCDTEGDDPTNFPGSVQAAGIARRQHYEAATGNTTPDMLDVLAYWARHDGVTLYSEDTTGHRTDITMHGAGQTMPDLVVITDDNGQPSGIVDVDQLQGDATKFMYDLAEQAGDDDALDKVVERWHSTRDPDEFGYLCAATLSLLVRCVLAPILDATDTAGIDLRTGLREAADHARNTL